MTDLLTSAISFPRDFHLRERFFSGKSLEHKARTNLYWLAWLLDRHTDQHEIVLDPMGGTGSILLAALKQRPVLSGDIERHWAELQRQNTLRIRETLFHAPACIAQWDAANLPLFSGCVPAIVTSPPYYDLFSDWNAKSSGANIHGDHVGETGLCYGFHPRQLGNLHVYEQYLRAMRDVYRECWRVLRPGGIAVLIVGDKVKCGRRVPVTDDTRVLMLSNGFDLLDIHTRQTIPSRYRRIHAQNSGPDYPLIETETALVFKKQDPPIEAQKRFAIVQAPRPKSSPGRQLFGKALAYANARATDVLVLNKAGLTCGVSSNAIWSGDHRPARARREWSHEVVREMVTKYGFTAGDHIDLHVSLSYARYLEQRLNTIGADPCIPTAHCNLGQKLAWYTAALDGQGGHYVL